MTNDADHEQHQGPTIRDKRRIDPETYQVREPQATAAPAAGTESVDSAEQPAADQQQQNDETAELKVALAERTSDLQRLQAEYVNYKRRVDRDREVVKTHAVEGVLKELLHVLDDVRSAQEHGELTGGFKAVAEEVQRVATKYGLEQFGTKGEPFNPHIHEALMHAHADGIDGPTCVEILQPGYRIGEKVLRPARVAVAEPSESPVEAPVVDQETATDSEQ
ncbi:nucleotide exchange factor GrpE [Microlunatus panaciterrae]|uniref:Protein GrpE n=1 Tax=Microlunatus panaciterrae TaxID=400768 RepID=A0ABS2RHV9_9ACTN|nr:nucleotide exchange factor GrpE [Microlunatus panaciterrae]MBM7798584.1 molecular chaperone GrpE [Microlunatus panaciterrae]